MQDTIARLYILDYGLFQVHSNGRIIGIQGYLIQTHDGQNILVDTGFPAKYAYDAEAASRDDDLGGFGHVIMLTEENLPTAQLALCGSQLDGSQAGGLSPSDIDILVMTHTHIDHVGGIGDFSQATLVISRAERALLQPLYWNNRSPIDWPANVQYHLIDKETILCPGITLIPTPGHTPGHLSLFLRLPQTGAVLLTADAISRASEPAEGFEDSWSPAQAQASAERLLALAAEEQAMIIYGHDPEQWQTLRKAPAYYE